MIENKNDDVFPEQINQFIDKYNKLHNTNAASTGNVYHIISEDIDGNITNECFALNVITNEGMKKYQKNSYLFEKSIYDDASAGGLFLGVGTGTPSISDTSLFQNAPYTTPAKSEYIGSNYYDSYYDKLYDISYDSNTDLISQRVLILTSVFDYNLSDITEDMTITEIGIGPSITNLYFHALVYDSEGNPSSFVKNINEKLTINVYSTISIKSSIFSELYAKGVYACFYPALLHKGYYRFYNNTSSGLAFGMHSILPLTYNNNKGPSFYSIISPNFDKTGYYANNQYLFGDTNTVVVDNVIYQDKKQSTGSYTITDKHQSINIITLRLYENESSSNHICIYPNLGKDVTEEIVSTEVMTNGIFDMGLDYNFGGLYYASGGKYSTMYQGHLPVSDIDISSLKLFNYKTGEYDIDVNVVDNNYHPEARYNLNKYTESYNSDRYRYISQDLTYIPGIGYVMVNENTSIPIKRFWCDNDSSITVQATDTFWDKSSLVSIPNKNEVPLELRTKKYYVFNKPSGLIMRYFDRDQQYPTIKTNDQQINVQDFTSVYSNLSYSVSSGTYYVGENPFISSDELEYITNGIGIFYPETYDGSSSSSIVSYRFSNIDSSITYDESRYASFIDNTSRGDIIVRIPGYSNYNHLYLIQVGNSSTTPIVNKYQYPEDQSYIPCASLSREYGILALQNMTSVSNQSTTAYIVKIYGDDGNYNPSTITLNDVNHCHVVYGTTKYVYMDLTNGAAIQINIADALTNTIEHTFTIDQKFTSVNGILGWKNHVYVCAYDSEYTKYVTIYYNIENESISILNDLNTYGVFPTSMYDYNNRASYGCSYIDECICINPKYDPNNSEDDNTRIRNLIITDNNPLSPIEMSYYGNTNTDVPNKNNSTFNNNEYNKIQVKKVNNGRNIILMKENGFYGYNTQSQYNPTVVVNDIGPIIYNNTKIKDNRFRQYVSNSTVYNGTDIPVKFSRKSSRCCLYKDSVHCMNYDGYVNLWRSSPFEAWETIKLVGTTKTIQSYNNPKNIGYDNFPVTFEVTNDASKII